MVFGLLFKIILEMEVPSGGSTFRSTCHLKWSKCVCDWELNWISNQCLTKINQQFKFLTHLPHSTEEFSSVSVSVSSVFVSVVAATRKVRTKVLCLLSLSLSLDY